MKNYTTTYSLDKNPNMIFYKSENEKTQSFSEVVLKVQQTNGNQYQEGQFDFGNFSLKLTSQENVGINGSAFYRGNIKIKPYGDGRWYAEAFAEVVPVNAGSAPKFTANISVYQNGEQVSFDYLSMSNQWGENVYDANWNQLGFGRVWLPATGDVQIRMVIGHYTYEFWNGHTSDVIFNQYYNLP